MSWPDAAAHGHPARSAPEEGMSAFDRLVLPRGAERRPARRRVSLPPDGRDLEPAGQPGGDSGGGCPQHCRPTCHPADCPDLRSTEVVHACPAPGIGWLPCCGSSVFQLPPWHRMTKDTALVTCPGRKGR